MKCRIRHVITVLTLLGLLWLVHISVVFFQQAVEIIIYNEEETDENKSIGADLEFLKVPRYRKTKSDGLQNIPVFIVEEHHEVLRYWFGSAAEGLIPKERNTLLHIDGHADTAIPHMQNIIPLYRQPTSRKEIYNMMQRNDVFIVTAALGKLINRYIWIWPPWDKSNHERDHDVYEIKAGLVKGNNSTTLCCCGRSRFNSSDHFCIQSNKTDADSYFNINRNDCNLISSGIVEIISESKAMDLLMKGDWITQQEDVILDIDEDYYGCETILKTLDNVDIPAKQIKKISEQIQFVFCPMSVTQETQADTIFHTLLQILIEMKSECTKKDLQNSCDDQQIHNAVVGMMPDILDVIYQDNVEDMLCNGKEIKMNALMLQNLLDTLAGLTIPQFKQLDEVGICLETAVSSFIDFSDGIHICHGSNSPNDTVVLHHSPTPKEIQERTRNLHTLLHSKSFTPSIITICRSVRDDYTPRSYFHKIEGDILKVLHESFPDVHWATVFYDKHLLGGKKGWPSRHH